MNGLSTALKYLSFLNRWGRAQPSPEDIGKAALYFWLIALLLGLALSFFYRAAALYIDPSLLSLIMVFILIGATGSVHLQGLRNTFDALATNRFGVPVDKRPVCGIIAVLSVVLLKLRAFDMIDELFAASLLVAPMLARWAWVLFVFGYGERCDEPGRAIANQVGLVTVFMATAATLAVSIYLFGVNGLYLALILSLLTLLFRALLHRCQSLISHDNFHAVIELAEALSFAMLTSL